MVQKHYKNELGAFIDHELSKERQHEIGAHLMKCGECRREHDRIKFGGQLAGRMERADAGADLWTEIESRLDSTRSPQIAMIAASPRTGRRILAGYAAAAVLVTALVSAAYFALFSPRAGDREQAVADAPGHTGSSVEIISTASDPATPESAAVAPEVVLTPGGETIETAPVPAWAVETLAGKPSVGAAAGSDRLAVGEFLETDAASKARIEVADIGSVEIAPNSRVRLVGTTEKEHRLSLERGALHARILAPPRLFIVDTPSAVAVDLGCEYKLEVDNSGNSFLHVTSGFVALERGGRTSIVPAGAMCLTRRGKGLGTPFSAETSKEFRAALERFDFGGGGGKAIDSMLEARGFYDMITLWHLLSRVSRNDRERIYDALAADVAPPAGVTREGILSLNKQMLEEWRIEVENAWFS